VSERGLKGHLALGMLVWQGHQKSLLKAALALHFPVQLVLLPWNRFGVAHGGIDTKKEERSVQALQK